MHNEIYYCFSVKIPQNYHFYCIESLVFCGEQLLTQEKINIVSNLLFPCCFMFLSLLFLLPSFMGPGVFFPDIAQLYRCV